MRPIALALALTTVLAACSHDDGRRTQINLSSTVPSGGTVHLRNMNGTVRVVEGRGPTVAAKAMVRGRGAEQVRFRSLIVDGDLYVCVMWSRDGQCDARGYKTKAKANPFAFLMRRGGVARADLTVELPAGVPIDAVAINGDVVVDAVRAPVDAETVNGTVRIGTSTGPVNAKTVNGNVQVRIASLDRAGAVSLESVNGNVWAELPPTFDGDVRLQTVNGRFEMQYPVAIAPGGDRRRLEATVGRGGRPVTLETVNGNVALRKLGG